jgi:inositol phosphorylceramide mannosyltransferase catalytic subunit|uniref:Glycosyltransferase n=1 Tax=viral metagenome TaxID=1070528 RepID=A0A6C0IMS0_9ZZZZ
MNVIQTWKSKDLPHYYVPFYNNVISHKKSWNYMFFDDNDIIHFIKNKMPDYYDFFTSLQFKIQQIDFFRYLAIYYYGGLYLDMDIHIESDFNDIQLHECAFPIELKHIDDPLILNQNQDFLIGNYAFYAKPKHPFIKYIIDTIVNPKITIQDIQAGCQNNQDPSEQVFVYYTTGPIVVSYCYATYPHKEQLTLLEKDPFEENGFGKYGSHKMYGSWKSNNSKDILK